MDDLSLTNLIADARRAFVFERRNLAGARPFDVFLAEWLADRVLLRDQLEQVGWACKGCGIDKKNEGGWCALGCGRDYNEMRPVYRMKEGQ